jgi:DNA recombination protein RmuC
MGRLREEVNARILEGLNQIQERLAKSSEVLKDSMSDSLQKGRGEQSETLSQSLRALEERFEKLRAGVEKELQGASDRLISSAKETRSELGEGLGKALKDLETKFGEVRAATEQKLTEIRGEVEKKLGETVEQNMKSFSGVADRLSKLHEATGQIVMLSKGVNDLNVLLNSPKARGAFGEMTLQQMLTDMFGEQGRIFELQYPIDGQERVDAAIFTGPDRTQIVCVDSKFPLANAQPLLDGSALPGKVQEYRKAFARDVLNRAKEIRDKYIRPPKTLEFAFMFVPAESVYAELLRDAKLHEDLLRMKVIPTSPNSFFAYLQAMAHAFRGLTIEKEAQEIQKVVLQLVKDFDRFMEGYKLVGTHLDRAAKQYETTEKRAGLLESRAAKLGRTELDLEGKDKGLLETSDKEEPEDPDRGEGSTVEKIL